MLYNVIYQTIHKRYAKLIHTYENKHIIYVYIYIYMYCIVLNENPKAP